MANGNSALHLAVQNGDHEAVTQLIEAGADLCLKNKNKDTSISMAERLIGHNDEFGQ
jgi:ankyrin repeat protein